MQIAYLVGRALQLSKDINEYESITMHPAHSLIYTSLLRIMK